MSEAYPTVALGEVMDLTLDAVEVDVSASYSIAGVYGFGRGLFSREPLSGSETTYKVFHRLHADDFVISKLKAWEGALATIPSSFDGWFLSPQFPTFRAKRDRLEIKYLGWYCKQRRVWEALRNKSRGMGARRDSVSPKTFLGLEIPLPPLTEQRRIVARIEELVGKVEEARRLRREAVEEAELLWASGARRLFADSDEGIPLKKLVTVKGGGTPAKSDPFFWKGDIPWVSPKDIKSRELFKSTDYITERATMNSSAKMIAPGAILIVVRGMILARTVPVAILRVPGTINQDIKALIPNESISPEYLSNALWALNNHILSLVEKSSHDTRKLQTPTLLDIKLSAPNLSEQRAIVEYLGGLQSHVDSLRYLQSETEKELEAMIPSILDRAFAGKL